MRVAFLIPSLELSGGVRVVVGHARLLRDEHDIDAVLVLTRADTSLARWDHSGIGGLPVLDLETASAEAAFDVAVATWWETTLHLHDVPASRYAYFVQSMEDRFYAPDTPERSAAALTHVMPLAQITEARWIVEQLAAIREGVGDTTVPAAHYVRNGVDKRVFAPAAQPPVIADGPLRVLIEGNPDQPTKAIPEALEAIAAMREPVHSTLVAARHSPALDAVASQVDRTVSAISVEQMADLYRDSHVVLKLSRVEGMAGPPLEGFHCGATCVSTPVTGHDEYLVDGVNALLTNWDDARGTGRLLDLLARDRVLLERLRVAALETARAWPSTGEAARAMAVALRAIADAPSPDPGNAAAGVARELRAGLASAGVRAREHERLQTRMARIDRLMQRAPVRFARRLGSGKGA